MSRRDVLAASLGRVEERIADACQRAGRDRSQVTLVVVTKTYPASDVALLADLGVRDIGENRHPEAGRKLDEVRAMGAAHQVPRCHFLGGVQTNKAGAVARYADVVHSVDRLKLVGALSRAAQTAGREVTCLVQVDFGVADGRSGVAPTGVDEIAEAITGSPGLQLGGVMTVAPLGEDPVPQFAHLAEISARLRSTHPDADMISAGMSEDFEQAIAAGATHLRIGRSILGERPPLR